MYFDQQPIFKLKMTVMGVLLVTGGMPPIGLPTMPSAAPSIALSTAPAIFLSAGKSSNSTQRAKTLLSDILSTADEIAEVDSRADVYGQVAQAYARLSEPQLVQQTLEQIFAMAQAPERVESRQSGSSALPMPAPMPAAVAVGREDWRKLRALESAVNTAIEINDSSLTVDAIDKAWRMSQNFDRDEFNAFEVAHDIAKAYVATGNTQAAERVLERSLVAARAEATFDVLPLINIAALYTRIGRAELAKTLLDEALTAEVASFPTGEAFLTPVEQSAIAQTYIDLQAPQTAQSVLTAAFTIATTLSDGEQQSVAFTQIAKVATNLSDEQSAYELLEKSITAVKTIRLDWAKAQGLAGIAEAVSSLENLEVKQSLLLEILAAVDEGVQDDVDIGQILTAITASATEAQVAAALLPKALAATANIQNEGYKAEALGNMATALVNIEDSQIAHATLQNLGAIASTMEYPYGTSTVFSKIASACSQLDQPGDAEMWLERATDSAENITITASKSYTLSDAASVYARLGNAQAVDSVLQSAFAVTQDILEDPANGSLFKAYALSRIASAVDELDDKTVAGSVLGEVLVFVESLQDNHSKAEVLPRIASSANNLGDVEALDLLAAILEITEDIQGQPTRDLRDPAGHLHASTRREILSAIAGSVANDEGLAN